MAQSLSHSFHLIYLLKINDLGLSLDKALILDRYSLFEVKLGWFYYSLFLYSKEEI